MEDDMTAIEGTGLTPQERLKRLIDSQPADSEPGSMIGDHHAEMWNNFAAWNNWNAWNNWPNIGQEDPAWFGSPSGTK